MFKSIARLFRNWKCYGDAMQELSQLSDYQLADIGISRSDIPRLAREHAAAEAARVYAPLSVRGTAPVGVPAAYATSPTLIRHDVPDACTAH